MIAKSLKLNNKNISLLFSISFHLILFSAILMNISTQKNNLQTLRINIISFAGGEINQEKSTSKKTKKQKIIAKNSKQNSLQKISETNSDQEKQDETQTKKINATNQGDSSSTIISDAKFINQTPPSYPQRSIELGQEGVVTLHVFLEENGKSKEIKISDSSGFKLLDLAALAAVKDWKFEPISKGQQIVSGWVRVPIRFSLN